MLQPTSEQNQLAEKLSMLYMKYQLDLDIVKNEPQRTVAEIHTMYKKVFCEFITEIINS